MDWISMSTLGVAAATLLVGIAGLYVGYRNRPPGGWDLGHEPNADGDVLVFGALGSARLYSVRFRSSGMIMCMDGQFFDAWPPGPGVRVVDVEREVRIPVGYLLGPDIESPTLEAWWVSDRDRYHSREGLRYHLDTNRLEVWRRHRVRLWRKQTGRWVESKRIPMP